MDKKQNLSDLQKNLLKGYSPEEFKKTGYAIVDVLSKHLKNCFDVNNKKSFTNIKPQEVLEKWETIFNDNSINTMSKLTQRFIEDSTLLHHPNYLGHQVSSPNFVSALADFTTSFLNNSNCVYEMGQASAAIEKIVCDFMAKKIGYDKNSGGFLTSGGTLGNLTALLSARQNKASHNIWNEGVCSSQLCVLVSEQAHYSVKRAIQVMGMGEKGAVAVKTNEDFTINTQDLKEKYYKARNDGLEVFAVVACSCSTATGSYDDLEELAEFCKQNNLWLHVDGAHGASALMSSKYKNLLKGIENADSVVWDAHKMMMTGATVTGVIFKNFDSSFETFSQKASYILDRSSKNNWFDYGLRTMECTKASMCFKVFCALKLFGEKFFSDFVDYTYDLTKRFADIIKQSNDFEIAVYPQSNIICFRHLKEEIKDLNAHQVAIRDNILNNENYYIVKTELNNKTYLRCTIINPLTNIENLNGLLDEIRALN